MPVCVYVRVGVGVRARLPWPSNQAIRNTLPYHRPSRHLLQLDIVLTAFSASVTLVTAITGLFAMNIQLMPDKVGAGWLGGAGRGRTGAAQQQSNKASGCPPAGASAGKLWGSLRRRRCPLPRAHPHPRPVACLLPLTTCVCRRARRLTLGL